MFSHNIRSDEKVYLSRRRVVIGIGVLYARVDRFYSSRMVSNAALVDANDPIYRNVPAGNGRTTDSFEVELCPRRSPTRDSLLFCWNGWKTQRSDVMHRCVC